MDKFTVPVASCNGLRDADKLRLWYIGSASVFQTDEPSSILGSRSRGVNMSSKYFEIMQSTDNPQIYKKARKRYLEGRGISCAFCKYHLGENQDHKYQKSWKKFRKTKYKMGV